MAQGSRAAKNFIYDKKDKKAVGGPVPRTSYSPKRAAAGKDLGKPGKNFAKIAKAAKGRGGAKVAGSILKKLRNKK